MPLVMSLTTRVVPIVHPTPLEPLDNFVVLCPLLGPYPAGTLTLLRVPLLTVMPCNACRDFAMSPLSCALLWELFYMCGVCAVLRPCYVELLCG